MLFCMAFLAMVFSVESLGMEIQLWLLSFVVMWISICYMLLIVFRKYAWVSLTKPEVNAMFLSENRHSGTGQYGNSLPSDKASDDFGKENQSGGGVQKGSDGNSKELSYTVGKQNGGNDGEQAQPQQVRRPSAEPMSNDSYGFSAQTSDIETTDSTDRTSVRASLGVAGPDTIASSSHERSDSEGDSQESSLSSPEEIQAMKQAAFKIAEKDGWEEYVDRNSGESFWIQTSSRIVSHTAPDVFIIPV
jgi:hypothetical protein